MTNSRERRRQPQHRREDGGLEQMRSSLDLPGYLDELTELRAAAADDLTGAGEHALKVLDRFLANVARALGMSDERPSMSDSLRWLERGPAAARNIARRAGRYRDTRNALAHNPDIALRPEAAHRIIAGVEAIVRMVASTSFDLARHRVVSVGMDEPLVEARDRMLAHGYNQLVVVDASGGVADLLTERDIVAAEAAGDLDDGDSITVGQSVAARGRLAVALLPKAGMVAEVVDALRDDAIGAVVVTENGRRGERPLGIVTRGDILRGYA